MHKGLVVLIIVLSIVLLAGGIYVHSVSKGLTEEEPVPYDPGDVFITNLKDGSGLVKVRLMLELKNKKAAENLTKVNYRLRDSIISVLRREKECREIGNGNRYFGSEEFRQLRGYYGKR
jgi:flagellar basal body-associated protein FliL